MYSEKRKGGGGGHDRNYFQVSSSHIFMFLFTLYPNFYQYFVSLFPHQHHLHLTFASFRLWVINMDWGNRRYSHPKLLQWTWLPSSPRGMGYSHSKLFIQSWWRLQDSCPHVPKASLERKDISLKYHSERVSLKFVKPNCKTLTFQNCNPVTLESSHRWAATRVRASQLGKG